MRIKFLKNYGIKEGQGAGPHYAADKEYEFKGPVEEGYARAYIERGIALEVVSLGDRLLGAPGAAEHAENAAKAKVAAAAKAEADATAEVEFQVKAKPDADAKAAEEKKAADAKDAKKK